MYWDSLDWEVLDRLRETFLSDAKSAGPYWHTITDLECYDFTFAERIGWKWDAVLAELKLRGWAPGRSASTSTRSEHSEVSPLHPVVLDWGCGSGIAGRRVVDFFGPQNFSALFVHDHSPLAVEFAEHQAKQTFPGLAVARADYRLLNGDEPIGLLVVSHVLNELNEIARAELAGLLARADAVLWVEPGTHEVSRALVGWREQLLGAGFHAVAPCTHQAACGLLAPGNERHWCHHFADPPVGIYADSNWVKFGQRAGIDLRALPYSFLVLDRRPVSQPAEASRILGDARMYKGYAKIFNCSAAGVEELTFQQRVDKELFKSLKRARGPLLYRWARDKTQIVGAEPAFK
jgi:ribosomal protein RSM22 (predicted rRNA methylase)